MCYCWYCCSKKDSSLRYTELLSHISPAVIRWVSINCQQLMSDHLKHDLVLSVIAHCNSAYIITAATAPVTHKSLLLSSFNQSVLPEGAAVIQWLRRWTCTQQTHIELLVISGRTSGQNCSRAPVKVYVVTSKPFSKRVRPHAGSGVVRIDTLHFLARCRKRRLNQALAVMSLSLGFFWYICCAVN